MSVHPDGSGTSWDDLEAVDVDQPHGLDYRYSQHLAKAVRKRLDKEHVAFADSTVGGEHIPGGCAILGIVDASTDISIDDSTFVGCNLLYDQTNLMFWCFTNVDGTVSAPDGYRLKLGPKSICRTDDFTWDGAHLFDASVDMSDVAVTGDLTLAGKFETDGTVNFNGDVAVLADASFDGTVDFGDGVAFAAEVSITGILKVDGTASAFGGTAGIGLWYDPTIATGGTDVTELTITIGNGTILKIGRTARTGTDTDISFATAFPTSCFQAFANSGTNANIGEPPGTYSIATTGFIVQQNNAAETVLRWWAIGR